MVEPRVDAANSRFFFFSSACRPFGMVNLSPDMVVGGTWASGYRYNEDTIKCFSHIHGWELSGIPVLPTTGPVRGQLGPDHYGSSYSHADEVVHPGYHKIVLKDYGITAELTSTMRVGFHRYTFPASSESHILFDFTTALGSSETDSAVTRRVGHRTLEGHVVMAATTRRPKPITVYFVVDFDKPFRSFGGWKDGRIVSVKDSIAGRHTGAYVSFATGRGEVRQMKVAISYVSVAEARNNLLKELPGWDFYRVVDDSRREWNDWLGRIEVEGGTLEERRRFYTDLWHALQGRRVVSDVSGSYIDMTGREPRVGQIPLDASGKPRFNHYNSDSYWGAQWSLNTLWGLVYPEVMESFVNSMLMMYDDGGLIPRGPSGGNYTYVMTGATTTPFIVSAYMKGIRGFDVRKAYEGMRKDHFPGGMMSKAGYEFNTSSGGGVEYYIKNGYVPYPLSEKKYGLHQDGSAQTLEYAYQDYAMAQMAGALGKKDDYSLFMRRAGNYKNIFLKDSGWMWTRDREGNWNRPVDVLKYEHGWVEGNAAQYTWFVPHDVAGLIRLMGGADKFTAKLNASFEKARVHGFVSGDFKNDHAEQERLRRVYINYGNQPCMETPFLFNYSGAPWLTQYWTRQLIDSVYSGISPQKGYGGDEDQGLMGALAVLLKTGLFATDGGVSQRPFYEISSPLFRRITIHLNKAYYPGGKFVIEARGNGPGQYYIQSAMWNGEPLNRPWLYHADVAKGGTLVLQMGDKPNKSWGSDAAAAPPSMSGGDPVWLDDLDLPQFSESVSATVAGRNAAGDSIRLRGVAYGRGLGVRTTSVLSFFLDGHGRRLIAIAGMDDRGNKAPAMRFYVLGDGKILFDSGPVAAGEAPRKVDVDLSGVRRLGLLAIAGDSGVAGGGAGAPGGPRAPGDWADARLIMERGYVPKPIPNTDEKYILTPASSRVPAIHSPKVFGVRPGHPFFYTIATTGQRPIRWSALGLPEGLSLDTATGIITGKAPSRGIYRVTVRAKNGWGEASRRIVVKAGDTIGLTPPMGWNGWNSWARDIDEEKVMASAEAMVGSELADHGWSYINVDDAWQGPRGGKYNAIQPNEKFPRFGEMIAAIHARGLRFGVYSTPWISSYAGYPGGSSDFADGAYPDSIRGDKRAYRRIGKYRFEKDDARQMADWGVDYLKYDWRIDLSSAERMADALRQSGRDIFYSLSNSAPFGLAADWMRVANSWRTGGDIRDSWISLYRSAFMIDKWGPYGGPGHWNDPDMLIVGNVTTGGKMHPTRLTPDEQYSHVSIFSLEAAPLLIGCPIEQLDAFTFGLLTNDEVIAIDQDPLGKPARLVTSGGGVQVWMRPLEDGAFAVGLFNTAGFGTSPQSYFRWGNEGAAAFELDLAKLGLNGRWRLRDVWRQKDLGVFDGSYSTTIRHHGVVLLRLSPADGGRSAAGGRPGSAAVAGGRYVSAAAGLRGTRAVWLDDLAIGTYSEDIRPISLRTSYKSADSLQIGGHRYGRGLGVQSLSAILLGLHGRASRLMAMAGADDGGNREIPLQFYVIGDGKILFASGDRRVGDPPVAVDVDLAGVQRLGLLVRDEVGGTANKRTNGDWTDVRLVMEQGYLPEPVRDTAARYILTPPPGKAPRINCAKVFGATPGSPFLFTV
ncbi:MAG TPA: GH92 family glycosyl hydrolase, partial [Puia sp.]|nr:GH92 family glycosyl hydrolase [Puia sp.]